MKYFLYKTVTYYIQTFVGAVSLDLLKTYVLTNTNLAFYIFNSKGKENCACVFIIQNPIGRIRELYPLLNLVYSPFLCWLLVKVVLVRWRL